MKCIEKFSDSAYVFQMDELTVERLIKLVGDQWHQGCKIKIIHKNQEEITLHSNLDLNSFVQRGANGKKLLKFSN